MTVTVTVMATTREQLVRQLRLLSLGLPLLLSIGLGCASPPSDPRWMPTQVQPGSDNPLLPSNVILLIGPSGSADATLPEAHFAAIKELAANFVTGMPDGGYSVGAILFERDEQSVLPLARFDRDALAAHVAGMERLAANTPLEHVFTAAIEMLQGAEGATSVVVFSDGSLTELGSESEWSHAVAAAARLRAASGDPTRLHLLQVGHDTSGSERLANLAALTPGDTYESRGNLSHFAGLYLAQRRIFLGDPLPSVAAPPPVVAEVEGQAGVDRDRDGVADAKDRCPDTPKGAKVDPAGCWVLRSFGFSLGDARLTSQHKPQLDEIGDVLHQNPSLRIRVDGYADPTGAERANMTLSELRAASVKSYLESVGIAASRIDARGYGEGRPINTGDIEKRMQRSRIVVVTVLQ